MKHSLMSAAPAAALAMIALLAPNTALADNGNGNSKKEPLIPVGNLDAFPTLVQTGTHPTLTWEIQYPESAHDIVNIDPDSGTVTPRVDLCMEIRVLGVSYQTGWDKRRRPIWGHVQAEARADSSLAWAQFFYDTQDKVKPNKAYRAPSETERAAMEDLLVRLKALDAAETDPEVIQTEVFAAGKAHEFENLRDWFQALYEVLLGQSQGPRFGGLAALYGVPETIRLIERALAGEDLSEG